MYCRYCGKEISDEAQFCRYCGETVSSSNDTKVQGQINESSSAESIASNNEVIGESGRKSAKKTKSGKKKLMPVLIIFAVILIFGAAGTQVWYHYKGYILTIKQLEKAINNNDAKRYVELLPESTKDWWSNYSEKERSKMSYEPYKKVYNNIEDYFYIEVMQPFNSDRENEFKNGYKMTYEITKEEKIKSSDISEVEKNFMGWYHRQIKISKGYRVTIKVTLEGENEGKKVIRERTAIIPVYMINGKWYLLDYNKVVSPLCNMYYRSGSGSAWKEIER